MSNKFEQGLERYFSQPQLQKIRSVKIGIAGAGGLGSNCAMFLVRSGFCHFVIVDMDTVDASNLNRQNYFLDQVDHHKVDALAENLQRINPAVEVSVRNCRLSKENFDPVFEDCTILVEAFDKPDIKADFAEHFAGKGKFLVTASGLAGFGTGNRIVTRQVRPDFYVVGDESNGIDTAPPLAPAVTIAAAKEADVVLGYVLGGVSHE